MPSSIEIDLTSAKDRETFEVPKPLHWPVMIAQCQKFSVEVGKDEFGKTTDTESERGSVCHIGT